MSLRGSSFSVPNAEGVPRLTDVALYLCGKAISCAWPTIIETDMHAAETIATWYLHHIAFMHDRAPSDSNEAHNVNLITDSRGGGEANFSLVFNTLCRGITEEDFYSSQQQERPSSVPTVFGFSEQLTSPTPPMKTSGRAVSGELSIGDSDNNNNANDNRRGFGYFEELLEIFRDVGGVDLRDVFLRRVIALITGETDQCKHALKTTTTTTTSYWDGKSVDERAMEVLPALSALFGLVNVAFAHRSAGSITRAFAVWISVGWNCASFGWQTYVARSVGCWLIDLEYRLTPKALEEVSHPTSYLIQPTRRSRACQGHSSRIVYPASDGTDELNITNMYTAMRRICEGCSPENKNLIELLTQNSSTIKLSGHNTLEYILGDTTMGGNTPDTPQSHHYILLRITSSVLLYAQFYLSVHSLDAARHCVQTAVLVGHQWRSNELLTMAHYSSFLVHIASQNTPAAAGDIAIVLQLADAASRREGDVDTEASDNAPRFNAGSLGYMGAALLLLICPGTVDTYLRSVIITGNVGGRPISSMTVGGKACIGGDNVHSNNSYVDSAVARSEHTVVQQTIAQTVRHALWLSELEAFLDPSSTVVTELITSIARKTLMIIAGHYGVRSALKAMNTVSLGRLLAQLEEEAVTTVSSRISYQPPTLLLREVLRHVTHCALAVQVGAADASPGAGPFNLLYDFLLAVETHYGDDGVEVMRRNFFFMSTYRFLCSMWLRKHGYMKSAYQELTRLSDSMRFYSGYCMNGNMINDETVSTSTRAETMIGMGTGVTHNSTTAIKDGLQYWPPDHLMLWQHVQFERAQLARYLGYTSTLPEIEETLRRVSAASHFVMGVLYADLISAMMWFQRGNYGGALETLDKVLSTSKGIGLTLLQMQAQSMRVFILLTCNRWKDALNTLFTICPLPSLLEPGLLLAELHARSELLMTCTTVTEDDLHTVVEHYVHRMRACGCFIDDIKEADSTGVSLSEKLCIYACLTRLAAITSSVKQQKTWNKDLTSLAQKMKRRQLQEGKWQLFCNTPIRRVCHDILSGALLQKL